jgi:ring-1,2-phenylacetyl-CoA epoxidase subunit PaaE
MSTPTFHRLRIRDARPETADSVSLAFEVPDALRDAYRFRAGQFLTLRARIDGADERRSYSICVGQQDYDAQGELRVAIKRVAGGRFSNWANDQLRAGQAIDVMTPDGRFHVPLDPAAARHFVGFAGGSGITPMLSLIKTTLATEPGSRFTLIYGNRAVPAIMFLEELEDLKDRYLGRLALHHVLSDEAQDIELLSGLLDRAKCDAFLAGPVPAAGIDEAFICGPEPMMAAAEQALRAAGVPAAHVHIERFGVPAAAPAAAGARPAVAAAGGQSDVVIVIDGKERRLAVDRAGVAILDAGLAAGIDLPFACKGGVCCSCRAKVVEGEVTMDKNFSLDAQEVAQGFVLSCQAHPVSARVVINFDER